MVERLRILARRQNGVLTTPQLHALGLTDAQIRTLLKRGVLHRIHRGVYAAADPALLPLAAQSAALLAVGRGGVLSHRSAAALWGLVAEPAVVEVLTSTHVRPRDGVKIHQVSALDPRDIVFKQNLRLTTPARTIIDLAIDAPARELERALAEARALRLLTDVKLEAALARAPRNHTGAAKIRALLRTQTGRALTRSQRERRMLSLLEQAQLPRPLVNFRLHGFEVDFFWPGHKLVVEFDGYTTHGTRPRFESDRRRDQILVANGISTMRITDRQLISEPIAVMARIAQAMSRN